MHQLNADEAVLCPPERRDARESIPAAVPIAARVPKTMKSSIPVYNADGSLYATASEQRLAYLQSAGLVDRVVRSRKRQIMRAILFTRPGESTPMPTGSAGTRYSRKERLEHGRGWDLTRLGGDRGGKNYAPAETCADFLQVVADCTVTTSPGEHRPARWTRCLKILP